MLRVVVERITPRIIYVFERIKDFRQGISFELLEYDDVNSLDVFAYTRNLKNQAGIEASDVLYDNQVKHYDLSKGNFNNEECLAFNGKVDPLAAIFFHLTRMEEYQTENYDNHGRFKSSESFVYQFGWMSRLMTERWIDAFLEYYQKETNQELVIQKTSLELTLTVDIDNTFAFKWKPYSRLIGSYLKDLVNLDITRLTAKTLFILGIRKDPYDSYDYIKSIRNQGINVQLFWLLGDLSSFDRNVSNSNLNHLTFIKHLSEDLSIDLHPSYMSNSSLDQLKKEKRILEDVKMKPVFKSRQHFLKLKFPSTYQRNINVGLEEDYTMGFGDEVGFRAGTLRSYPFFDLTKNQEEHYIIHPFAYMDGTFRDYLKLDIQQSKEMSKKLIDEAKQYGGNFIVIWHNESLGDWGRWKGWREILEYTIQQISKQND